MSAPNHAHYDESLANPFPQLPEALTLKNGKKVTSAKMWWEQRRPEIVEPPTGDPSKSHPTTVR